ncbi:MAG TPA: hypothetical protein VG944_05620 [Fimbriimonas sp.]|nr:hypothetical protein [Fimbriimonas sp.]
MSPLLSGAVLSLLASFHQGNLKAVPATDDTSALQSALKATAKALHLPAGTFQAVEYRNVTASQAQTIISHHKAAFQAKGYTIEAVDSKDLISKPELLVLKKGGNEVLVMMALDGSNLLVGVEKIGTSEGWVVGPPTTKPTVKALSASANSVRGEVVRSDGSPLNSGTIRLNGMVHGAVSGLQLGTQVVSDDTYINIPVSGGTYQKHLEAGYYYATGTVQLTYDGKSAPMDLTAYPITGKHPYDHSDSRPGFVRNFWLNINLGTLTFSDDLPIRSEVKYPAGSILTITLKPTQALLDGSTGKTLIYRKTFAADTTVCPAIKLEGIPLGDYEVAVDVNGKPVSLISGSSFNVKSVEAKTAPGWPSGKWSGLQFPITFHPN